MNEIKRDGKFDVIHDHNGYLGPLALAYANDLPPAIHTIHGPPMSTKQTMTEGLPDNRPMWDQFGEAERLWFVGISKALVKPAPAGLRKRLLDPVYNAIELDEFEFKSKKEDYFITLARFSKEKGQGTAAKICDSRGYKLKMAGIVAGIATPRQLLLEIANPLSPYRSFNDFKYYSDNILPITVHNPEIQYVGNVSGDRKISFINRAKALLFPIDWEEPFGMAPIEALACGTPVVSMARGALPEIIEHGVNGFLAKTTKEFEDYMTRVDEIDPAECRKSVERKFSAEMMAQNYVDRYRQVIGLAG
jgi:glycosyltransferase involved in cell wall biosynthesis